MVTRKAAQAPWALVLVALAALAVSGRGVAWAQATRNETAASANGETLDALLSTTSRAFSTSECVESIRMMKHSPFRGLNWSPEVKTSFPPDETFIPPGAEAWCNCLRDNEPAGGIPSDYEGVFNTCREQVLEGSDYNAMDLCRGMVPIFRFDFFYHYTTFCMRELCQSKKGFFKYYGTDDEYPFSNFVGSFYFYGYSYNMDTDCSDECMQELSAWCCTNYRLTYSGWVRVSTSWGLHENFTLRRITVDGNFVACQYALFYTWGYMKVNVAEKVCGALYAKDQGRCCTYERGYATLSQCCYWLENGALEFNCRRAYGGDRLRYNCAKLGNRVPYYYRYYDVTLLYESCNLLIDFYVAHPTYQQAKLAKLPDGQTSVVFPEVFIDDFCNSKKFNDIGVLPFYSNPHPPFTREYCCYKMNAIFGKFVENCQPGAGSHPSLGATRLPPSVAGPQPTPPLTSCDACSYVDENGDCKSVCKNNQQCTVRKGKAVCVQCRLFWQDFPDGKNRQCCELRDGDSGTLCRPKVTSKGEKNECLTNEGPWNRHNGDPKDPQPYTIDAVQNVCYANNNFWVNRKLCEVKEKANGEKRCKYINERKRRSILAGR